MAREVLREWRLECRVCGVSSVGWDASSGGVPRWLSLWRLPCCGRPVMTRGMDRRVSLVLRQEVVGRAPCDVVCVAEAVATRETRSWGPSLLETWPFWTEGAVDG